MSTSHQQARHTHRETPKSLIWHTHVYMGSMNEHYHLDSGSFVRQQGVDLLPFLEVSSQLWADQYSLQWEHFKESEC